MYTVDGTYFNIIGTIKVISLLCCAYAMFFHLYRIKGLIIPCSYDIKIQARKKFKK
jgi:hypothetical protein